MATAAVNAVTELIPSFSGRLLQPDDALFDEARRVHNGLVDKRPGVIARCLGAADVVDALGLASSASRSPSAAAGTTSAAAARSTAGCSSISRS